MNAEILLYKCPKCGSRRINISAVFSADMRFDDDGATLESAEFIRVDDTDRCRCLECGHIGRLYCWEVKKED